MNQSKKRSFVINHIFRKIGQVTYYSGLYYEQSHFDTDWVLCFRYDGTWNIVTLKATRLEDDWSMETKIEIDCEPVEYQQKSHTFSKNNNEIELVRTDYSYLKPHLVDDNLNIHVKIFSNFPVKKKLRNFDDDVAKEVSDVLLIIENQKFYVSKLFLASHSTYFKSLFFGSFEESKKSEIELKDIDADDFQDFLELINGESYVEDGTVEGILAIADFFDAKTALRRCEDFLMRFSKDSLRNKFGLAIKYKLDNLKNKCHSDDCYRRILPGTSDYIERQDDYE
ncbi:hypothetical protein B9Z55_005019 [Caenorhabditis nigoni]|uniref:BTB domain-containing protein n=1 Tax=Caenorhabditis nigoni TaxID=1611254 RepID=A0A2G5UZ18_9PELO|nr:hypothetical protein B9Z55_005019 [Caenorhabditis nigoni]